jgi:preprotein translocase subunit SecE
MANFEDMERTGEIEKGQVAYVQSIIDELKKIEKA